VSPEHRPVEGSTGPGGTVAHVSTRARNMQVTICKYLQMARFSSLIHYTMKMEATCFSETSTVLRATQHITEDGILLVDIVFVH
jgi:hypothetical protein